MTKNSYLLTPNRIRILEILSSEGGEIRDEAGQATSYLMTQSGHRTTNALSGMLMAMEKDGLIARDTAGRRTYSIRLTPLGTKAAAEHGAAEEPAAPAPAAPPLELNGVDLDLLAGVLLKKALVATQAQEASAGLKDAQAQIKAAEARVSELQSQLRASQTEADELRAMVKTLEHNNQVLTGQMDKVRKNPGTPIKDLISRTELRDLEKLMRSLPSVRS